MADDTETEPGLPVPQGEVVNFEPVPPDEQPKRGRKPGYRHTPFAREKIKTTQLLNRAHSIALGETDCTPQQARILCNLLDKVIPGLQSEAQLEAKRDQKQIINIVTGIDRDAG